MNRIPRALSCLAACLFTSMPSVAAQPAKPPQIILLDNGHVLQGRLIDEGERVLIRLGKGSQLRLPRGRVRAVAGSIDEVYRRQHRQLHDGDILGRVALARWCLRNDLATQAERLLVELTKLAPRDPQVLALERQMRHSQKADRAAPNDSPVRPATAIERPTPPPAERIPVTDLVEFTQSVQPVLLNHCAASGCHGVVATSEFQLLRPLRGQRLTQRMTRSNLVSVLEHVDPATPLNSPLWNAATSPHGERAGPIIGGFQGERSLQTLREWLASLEKDARQEEAAVSANDAETPQQRESLPPFRQVPTESGIEKEARPPADSLPATNSMDPANGTGRQSRGVQSPRDPYSPETFNRRFFPERFETDETFGQPAGESSSPKVNRPASRASRNATLLESNVERPRRVAGENQ